MKIPFAFSVLVFLVFIPSCKEDKPTNPFLGQWVMVDNYKAPQIYEFKEYFFVKLYSNYPIKHLYKVKNDTILTQSTFPFELNKAFYTFNDDHLTISHLGFYSKKLYTNKFYKISNSNFLEYFNEKLKLGISIPSLEAEPLTWIENDNFFFYDIDSTQSTKFLVNGEKSKFDSRLREIIIEGKDNRYQSDPVCFIDKWIKYKDFYPLLKILASTRYNRVKFVCSNRNNQYVQQFIPLPEIKHEYHDSLYPDSAPWPSINIENFKNSSVDFFCEFNNELIFVNHDSSSLDLLLKSIKYKLLTKSRALILINFSSDVTFNNYLHFYSNLINNIKIVRDSLLVKKYGMMDNFTDEQKSKLNNVYRIDVFEVTYDNLTRIRNN
jgi:hypothetical protein